MFDLLPKITKKISSFIMSEEGSISKQSLLTLGTFVGSAAVASVLMAKSAKSDAPTISSSCDASSCTVTVRHAHHASHSSHSSHSSHQSHSSHSSHQSHSSHSSHSNCFWDWCDAGSIGCGSSCIDIGCQCCGGCSSAPCRC